MRMAVVSNSIKDFAAIYQGFPTKDVGLGTIEPNIYATKSYQKKKIDKILIGGLQSIKYAAFEHDPEPLILALKYEPQYNTIIAWNLHYLPVDMRKAVLEIFLRSNEMRIRQRQPLLVDDALIDQLNSRVKGLKNCIRRYKVAGIKVLNQYTLLEWETAVEVKGRWSNWYAEKNQKKSAFKMFRGFFKKFFQPPKNPPRRRSK